MSNTNNNNSEDEEESDDDELELEEEEEAFSDAGKEEHTAEHERDEEEEEEARAAAGTAAARCCCVPEAVLSRLRPSSSSSAQGRLKMVVLDIMMRVRRGRGTTTTTATEALLVGRAEDGLSACLRVTGWYPYLLVRAPRNWPDAPHAYTTLQALLQEKLETYFSRRRVPEGDRAPPPNNNHNRPGGGGWKRRSPPFIHRIALVQGRSVYGFHEEALGLSPFLKIEVAAPHLVRALRDTLVGYEQEEPRGAWTKGAVIDLHPLSMGPMLFDGRSETFHSNIDAVQQFMVDAGLVGCQWVAVAGGAPPGGEEADDDESARCSACAHEWTGPLSRLEMLDVEAEGAVGPLRLLSFDIEAAGRRGVFPQASQDPVIQIALHFQVMMGQPERLRPVLLSLRACDPIEGADVLSFEDEADLLRAFRDLVVAFDADVLMGYNILGFDFPYLHDRAAALCGAVARPEVPVRVSNDEWDDIGPTAPVVAYFDRMPRVRGQMLTLRETEYHSAQTGKRKRTRVTIAGRVSLDMLVAIQNSAHRLEMYKLDYVAEYFLKDRKEDVPFTQITPMWLDGPAKRRELGVYCLKDAQLPLDLNAKINSLMQTIEMARSTGIPFDAVLQRGIMVRNTSLLLRRALQRGLLFPDLSVPGAARALPPAIGRKQRYTGATVLEPVCGIHPYVGVLDFSAMYPSIIRAHNLCYSTIVLRPDHALARAKIDDGVTDEALGALRICGHTFVTERHFKGLIPEVVEHLQNCRTKAKRALAAAEDPLAKQVCAAREQAFKVAGNGVYGALGSTLSFLPLLAIAESVTALGRHDIMRTKAMAEAMYPDGAVVYGDTDSVFVRMPMEAEVAAVTVDGVARAMEMSVALAERVNACLLPPKKIAFEKVFSTMLLLSKKRYAGLKYAEGFVFDGRHAPSIDVKGLQSVRRDGCALVRNLVREVIDSILGTGAESEAGALVRRRLIDLMEDKVPYEDLAIKKTLRKAMHDCCHPMRPEELASIRTRLSLPVTKEPLSYMEQDQAILAGVPLPWRMRVRLPHVMLAWRLRLKDPGSAPVPGESISYLITCNGGGKCFEKAETLDAVRERLIPVDHTYYLKALRVPLENIFVPIVMQRIAAMAAAGGKKKRAASADEVEAKAHVEFMLWGALRGRRFEPDAQRKKASIEASPIAQAFARQRKAAAQASSSSCS